MDKLKKLMYSDYFWVVIFLLPNFLGFLIFILLPVIASFGLSFVQWDLLTNMTFIGLSNYADLFTSSLFWKVLWNTIYYTIGTVPLGIVISLILAIALNQKLKGVKIFRAIYFLPVISSTVAVA
ncbi:MAG: carbohydrate ABC transporter permease, partial [Halanaerobiales bacterium]